MIDAIRALICCRPSVYPCFIKCDSQVDNPRALEAPASLLLPSPRGRASIASDLSLALVYRRLHTNLKPAANVSNK